MTITTTAATTDPTRGLFVCEGTSSPRLRLGVAEEYRNPDI